MSGANNVSSTPPGSDPKSPDQPVRVLLVDDEKIFVDTLAKRLERRGFHTAKATSGLEGIQLLRKHDFDVAILDLKMEDMDGLEVLKIFMKMDPHLVVIMLSGHGSETAAHQGITYGAFDYLTKPCELEDLLTKIDEAYRSKQHTRTHEE